MIDSRHPVIVLGATGMVGQRTLALLQGHSRFMVTGIAASSRSEGLSFSSATEWRLPTPDYAGEADTILRACDPQAFSDHRGIAFSALPADEAREVEPAFAAAGWAVVSNAAAFRQDETVPLVVPEVNADHLALVDSQDTPGFIVTNPNCVAIPLALSLKPLDDAFGVEQVVTATYQAVSGAGFSGETAWDMIGSVHPHPGDEEEKVALETPRLLGSLRNGLVKPHPMTLSARCVRVPVREGHMAAVSVRTTTPVSPEDALRVFQQWAPSVAASLPSAPDHPLRIVEGRNRPSPTLDNHGMLVTIGRVEACPVMGLKYYVLGHNTIRGAAGAALLNAELLLQDPWRSRLARVMGGLGTEPV